MTDPREDAARSWVNACHTPRDHRGGCWACDRLWSEHPAMLLETIDTALYEAGQIKIVMVSRSTEENA